MIYKRHMTLMGSNGKRRAHDDRLWDDGTIIHHADRTPENILTALDNAPNEDS
jgi:hypothetical protein